LIGGGVFRLQRHGQAELFLNEADGVALLCPNFVLLDHQDRVWICCLTQQDRKSMTSYSRARRDGYLVMVDHAGARIVADGIGFPNEVRVDPTGRYLYTNETLAARLLRYPLRPDGSLGPQEVIAEFDESNMFDGFNLDSEGGAWLTTLVSNRLWHVAADGRVRLLIEDSHPELLSRLVEQQLHNRVDKSVIYDDRGLTLKNISSVAFGGDDLKTAYLGSLMGEHVLSFRSPISGMEPAHWNFGPFD
jgi:sugar lactone lactonase YvrE